MAQGHLKSVYLISADHHVQHGLPTGTGSMRNSDVEAGHMGNEASNPIPTLLAICFVFGIFFGHMLKLVLGIYYAN